MKGGEPINFNRADETQKPFRTGQEREGLQGQDTRGEPPNPTQ